MDGFPKVTIIYREGVVRKFTADMLLDCPSSFSALGPPTLMFPFPKLYENQ
jgi:hypothetical protein